MIKLIESLGELPLEYSIDVYLEDEELLENNNMILKRRYIKIPNKIYSKKTNNEIDFKRQMNKFTSTIEHKMKYNFRSIVEHKMKPFLNPNFNFTISNVTFGSDSVVVNSQRICLAIYIHISVDTDRLNISKNLIPKLNLFKIRFAEHTSKQEIASLSNKETLILNSIEVLNARRHPIEHQVENILRSRYELYDYLYRVKETVTSFDQIPQNIFNNCLKFKNKVL